MSITIQQNIIAIRIASRRPNTSQPYDFLTDGGVGMLNLLTTEPDCRNNVALNTPCNIKCTIAAEYAPSAHCTNIKPI